MIRPAAFLAPALAVCLAAGSLTAAPRAKRPPLALRLSERGPTYATTEKPGAPLRRSPIRNLGEVVPGCIYRSGQPTQRGYVWLKEQGFKSIVCLRKEHDNDAERMDQYGFNYLRLPIPDHHAPTMAQGEVFLRFAANRGNWPLLVHCEAGMGRAACMSALIRYSFDGWSMSLALKEARNYRPLNVRVFGRQRRFLNRWAKTHPRGGAKPASEQSDVS